jgi:hypothetical protein
MNVAPSSTFEAVADGFSTGLAGTLGVRLRDNQGNDAIPRTTVGIVEDIPGLGIYRVTLTAPAVGGQYTIVWDDGSGTAATESLVVSYSASSPGPSDSFATVDDFAARIGVTLTGAEQTRAQALLVNATGLIREETGQTISLVTDDVLVRRSVFESRFRLPQRPVLEVSQIRIDGAVVDASSYYLDGDEVVRVGSIDFACFGGGWLGPSHALEVTYTHGYAVIPSLAKTVCMEAVNRVWQNPGAVIQERVGDVAVTYAPFTGQNLPVGLMLTESECGDLRDFFSLTSGTVQTR